MSDPVTHRETVDFAYQTAKPFAAKLAAVYYDARKLLDEFDAKGVAAAVAAPDGWLAPDADVQAYPDNPVGDAAVLGPNAPTVTAGDLLRLFRMAAWVVQSAEADSRYMVRQCVKVGGKV